MLILSKGCSTPLIDLKNWKLNMIKADEVTVVSHLLNNSRWTPVQELEQNERHLTLQSLDSGKTRY